MTAASTLRSRRSALFESEQQIWETPPDLYATVDGELRLNLDACALPHNTKCERFYSPEDDALTQPWNGRVWCNPEFSQVGAFVTKAVEEIDAGRAELVCLLTPARTDTLWAQALMQRAAEIRMLAGRVRFVGATEPCPFPVMLTIATTAAVVVG